jgi:hypothetical protein
VLASRFGRFISWENAQQDVCDFHSWSGRLRQRNFYDLFRESNYAISVMFLAWACTEHNVLPPGYQVVFQKAVHSYLPNPLLMNSGGVRRHVHY